MMKYVFYFTLKLFFFLIYVNFYPGFFGHERKRFNKESKFNLKIYVVIYWEKNNYNTHVAQYLKK